MASCGEVDHSVDSVSSSKVEDGGDAFTGDSPSSPTPSANPVPECAICLQTCVHPVRLPCRHVFCFLCVKGASWHSKRCALCRQEVPEDFLEHPTLLSPEELKAAASGGRGGTGPGSTGGDHAWYYEGRNGWWQYDERTSRELEDAFSKGKKTAEMLIAGFLYVADLENMVQYRRNEHGRRRKIKRDVVDIPKKGVAGLRLDTEGGVQGSAAAGRGNSADGADTSAAAVQQAAAAPAATTVLSAPARPPTSLGGQPGSPTSPSLEDTLALLHISPTDAPERAEVGEGEEEATATPSMSSSPNTYADGSGDWSDDEGDGEAVEPREQRLRLGESLVDRSPPGAEASSSSSVRSRRPDGQCTEV